MPRVIPSAPARPASVDASVTASAGTRVVTMILPERWSESKREAEIAKQTAAGKELKGICDLTGEPIFNDKNVNEIHNEEREEFHGLVMSTTVMREIAKLK